jgi:putative component of membrane protein insertase Oxa1/YidC/SpoIIIJ protein YidD
MLKEKIECPSFFWINFDNISNRPALSLAGFVFLLTLNVSASLIDENFKLIKSSATKSSYTQENAVGNLYRGFLSKSMYSKCRWFPSDSEYLKLKSLECGQLRSTILAFARFMSENDASDLASEVLNDHGHIRFLNYKVGCELF